MCLIFLSLKNHSQYKFVLAANRDEFYKRSTAPAHFWDEHPTLLAGRDLEAMGSWLGMTNSGKISMLTNYRDLKTLKSSAPSRGQLVSDYLIGNEDPVHYLNTVAKAGDQYNGFNLLVGNPDALWYYSNFGNGIRNLSAGIFGLSNHLLDSPWPKVERGKTRFQKILSRGNFTADDLFDLLLDEEKALDNLLPDTGLDLERERALSSIFIKTPDYGSRSSTVILVDHDNNVLFTERVFDLRTFSYTTQTFQFNINLRDTDNSGMSS